MKAFALGVRLKALRDQPHWTLLAGLNGPWTIGLLQAVFEGHQKRWPTSILVERLRRELEDLEVSGEFSMAQTPQRYLGQWVDAGWLWRRLPPGGSEEEYELTADTLRVFRHLDEIQSPRSTATESRLATVFQKAQDLADRTNPDPQRRIEALEAQQKQIADELVRLRSGEVSSVSGPVALEGLKDILALVAGIPEDFHRVRDSFERLNADLRQRLVDHEGHRSEVLAALFEGRDLIAESEAGRTFGAFWSFLRNPGLQAAFSEAVDALLDRSFAQELVPRDRRILEGFSGLLLREATEVQRTHQALSQSLRTFVRTNQFRENRQVNELLRRATVEATALKDRLRPGAALDFALTLTTSSLGSLSQLVLGDPSDKSGVVGFEAADSSTIGWEDLQALVARTEIDWASLRRNVVGSLDEVDQVTVAELVAAHGSPQGLATVMGYLSLALDRGVPAPGDPVPTESLGWDASGGPGDPGWHVTATVPRYYFVRGCEDGWRD